MKTISTIIIGPEILRIPSIVIIGKVIIAGIMLHQRVPQLLIVVEVEHLPLIAVGVGHQHPHAKQDLHVTRREIRHPHERQVGQDLHVNEQDKRLRTASRAFLLSHPDLVQMEPLVIVAAGPEGAVVIAAEVIVGAQEEVDLVVAVVPEEAVAEDDKQNLFYHTIRPDSYRDRIDLQKILLVATVSLMYAITT